ncbi:hypothetical protein CHUAL_002738 [Chamberlinius hualienensis]
MDPFTQLLMERTKESRRKLEAKLSNTPQPLPRKRRSPLQDNVLIVLEKEQQQHVADDVADDSPGKRQCVESKHNNEDLKENKPDTRIKHSTTVNKQDVKCFSSTTTSAAASVFDSDKDVGLRSTSVFDLSKAVGLSSAFDSDKGVGLSSTTMFDSCKGVGLSSTTLESVENGGEDIKQNRTKRLAKLAAHINSWEDDFNKGNELKCSPTKSKVKTESTNSLNRPSSCSSSKAKVHSKSPPIFIEDSDTVDGFFNDEPPVILLGVSKSPEKVSNACPAVKSAVVIAPKATPRRRSSSFSVSSNAPNPPPILARKKSFSPEKRNNTKTIVWDQAVVATLEAQGFVQSPSRSKLEYKFNSKKRVSTDDSSSDISNDSSSEDDDAKRYRKSEPSKSPVQSGGEPERISVKRLAEKFTSPFVIPNNKECQKDPANLPLSARVALFESQANNTPSGPTKKQVGNNTNNFSGNKQKAVSPLKTPKDNGNAAAEMKSAAAEIKTRCGGNTVAEIKSKFSPTKSAVGCHTVELHRQLFENSKSWKGNDISQKLKENKEKDLEVVLNRWNKKSKQAAENAAFSVTSQRIQAVAHSTPSKEKVKVKDGSLGKKKTVEPALSGKKCLPPAPPPLPPPVSFVQPSITPRDLQYLEPPIDSEEELNRALAVVDAICTEDDDETDLDSSILKEAFQKIEPVKPIPSVRHASPPKIREEQKCDDEERSDSLLHTISFYRRQKEMTRFTVLKNVIRNECEPLSSSSDSKNSSSNDDDEEENETSAEKLESIQLRIKNLQEEVIVQQAVMRQASQALVLCRSNEKFQGSLEQIEGERDFVHFFIILVKHRGQVISTQMTSTMDGISAAALHFPNLINIRNLERDFNVIVEMITPKIQSPGGPNVICTSSFALIGFTTINLKTLNRKTWNLEKIPFVSPLEGSLIMKIRCYSDFTTEEQGFLTMFDDVGGFGAWHRRWFVLSNRILAYWKYPDDVKQKCITSDVGLVPRDICARPHTFMLLIVRPNSKENADSLVVHNFKSYATVKVLLSADTKEERISWCQLMNKGLENLRTWDPEALRPIPEDFDGFKISFLYQQLIITGETQIEV